MNIVLVDQRAELPELKDFEPCRQCGISITQPADQDTKPMIITADGMVYWITPAVGPFCSVPCALRYMEINL